MRSIGWTSNPYVFPGISALLVLQTAVVHLPFLQAVFHTEDLTGRQWALAATAGAVAVLVVAMEKWWRRRRAAAAVAATTQGQGAAVTVG